MTSPNGGALKSRRDKVKVLLSVYGVPLRVGPSSPSDKEKEELIRLKADQEKLQAEQKLLETEITRLKNLLEVESTADRKKDLGEAQEKQKQVCVG